MLKHPQFSKGKPRCIIFIAKEVINLIVNQIILDNKKVEGK